MHKILLICFLVLITALCWAEIYLPGTQIPVDSKLYSETMSKAEANIKNLPQVKAYRRLLKQHPDIVMAYMLAYELNAVLAEAEPRDILDNYHTVLDLLQDQGTEYTPEFFLSYIAKQTVSDERIQAYRRVFLDDGLRDLMQEHKEPVELFRAISLWCLERLVFKQTSGRDQTPLDITQKSLIGRCEEMQILIVAACRTAGIPSRPASTPYWAHTDNNHAWAEIFINGQWHYTGDMDSAYFLNQTWFSGLIDKTVLILADGSLPSESDEVLIRGKYESVINSTPNYARERTVKHEFLFTTTDSTPLANLNVHVMVYNWSSLRPIITLITDSEGKLAFSSGRGDFYLMAFKDSLHALVKVNSSSQTVNEQHIVLSTEIMNERGIMNYPANEMKWQTPPESYHTAVSETRARWQQREYSFAVGQSPAYSDSLYYQVWDLCRNNIAEFDLFAGQYKADPIEYPGFYSYLSTADPKFLWQADSEQFAALFHFYKSLGERVRELKGRELHSLLSPTVHYEELPRPFYRKRIPQLYPDYFAVKSRSSEPLPASIVKMLRRRYKETPSKALIGLLRLDISTRMKHLMPYQFKILAVSALRANGLPAEYTRIPNVINIYWDGQWRYYDLSKNDFREAIQGAEPISREVFLRVLEESQGKEQLPLRVDESNLLVSFYQDGYFYPTSHQFEYIGDGAYSATLPLGEYYLQTGYRISDSQTFYNLSYFEVKDVELPLGLLVLASNFPSNWQPASSDMLPLIAELEMAGFDYAIAGSYHEENSIRIAELLRQKEQKYVIMGEDEVLDQRLPYLQSEAWARLRATDGYRMQTLTLRRTSDGKWQMYKGLWYQLPE